MKKYLQFKQAMDGLQNVKDTIRVVEKTAAANIHLLKKNLALAAEYKQELEQTISHILEFTKIDSDHTLLQKRSEGQRAVVVLGGSKGMVGGLYHEILNTFLKNPQKYQTVWVLGNKIDEMFDEENIVTKRYKFDPGFLSEGENIQQLIENVFALFQDTHIHSVDILYANFDSLAKQTPVLHRLLPFDFLNNINQNRHPSDPDNHYTAGAFPIFTSKPSVIFSQLLPKYIHICFTEIILTARLSELSARTVTTEHAIKQTEEIIGQLNLRFAKEHRKFVTQKQLESYIGHKYS